MSETPKNTPNKIGGINKNLLTPCRRPGLARKSKGTPIHKQQNIDITLTPSTLKVSKTSNKTIVKSNNSVCDSNSEVIAHDNSTQEIDNVPNSCVLPKIKCQTNNSDIVINTNLQIEQKTPVVLLERKINTSKRKLTSLSMNKCSSKNNDDSTDCDDSTEEFNNSDCVDSFSGFLKEEQANCKDLKTTLCIKSGFKRKQLSYSSDEDDFSTSQKVSSLKNKIAETKDSIKMKEIQLEKLKQAAIYKKLHNVDELRKVSSLWKTACIAALQHLLPKLQQHAEIDMEMLLKNLKIPSNILKYSKTDDSLV